MAFMVKFAVIFIITRCLVAWNMLLPSPDSHNKFKRIQNAPHDLAQASSNLDAERDDIDEDTQASYTLASWQDFEAQHPLGPFTAISSSYDAVPADNDQQHQAPSIRSDSDGLTPSGRPDQSECTMSRAGQDVSNH